MPDRIARPQAWQQVDHFVHSGAAFFEWNVDGVEFLAHPASANTQIEPVIGKRRHRRRLSGQHERVV